MPDVDELRLWLLLFTVVVGVLTLVVVGVLVLVEKMTERRALHRARMERIWRD